MGLFNFGKQVKDAGEGVKDAADGIGGIAESIRFAVTGDIPPETKEKLMEIAANLELEKSKLVNSVNLIDAKSKSFFQYGWRPMIGWIGGISLAFYYIPQFMAGTWFWIKTMRMSGALATFPISPDGILELVLGMLGIGALRTLEKTQGVQNQH